MLKIRIETNNQAFKESLSHEIKDCLDDVASQISLGNKEGFIYETNGNKCGSFKLTNR